MQEGRPTLKERLGGLMVLAMILLAYAVCGLLDTI